MGCPDRLNKTYSVQTAHSSSSEEHKALILCGWSYTAFGFGFLTACVLDLLLLECVVPWGSGVCVCVCVCVCFVLLMNCNLNL